MPPALEKYLSILVNLKLNSNKSSRLKNDSPQNTKNKQVNNELEND